MNLRTITRYLRLICAIVALTPAAVLADGAGVRGGGEIVVCDSSAQFTVYDLYMARKNLNHDLNLPLHLERNSLRTWLASRLSADPQFQTLVLNTWDRIGAAKTWKNNNAQSDFKNFLKSHRHDLLVAINMASSTLHQWVSGNVTPGTRTYDSFSDDSISANCRIEQLATNNGTTAEISHSEFFPTDDLNQRIIELHETFYILGRSLYEHPHPILTRTLIQDLLDPNKSSSDLNETIHQFTDFVQNRANFIKSTHHLDLGIYHVNPLFHTGSRRVDLPATQMITAQDCPNSVVLEYDGSDGMIAYTYYLNQDGQNYKKVISLQPGKFQFEHKTLTVAPWKNYGGILRTVKEKGANSFSEIDGFFTPSPHRLGFTSLLPVDHDDINAQISKTKLWKNIESSSDPLPYACFLEDRLLKEISTKDWIWLMETYLNSLPSQH